MAAAAETDWPGRCQAEIGNRSSNCAPAIASLPDLQKKMPVKWVKCWGVTEEI